VLIAIGLIAVAAASPAAGQRYSGGGELCAAPLFLPPDRLDHRRPAGDDRSLDAAARPRRKRCRLIGALFLFLVLLFLVPIIGVEVNGAVRWLGVGFGQFQPSEFLKPFFVVASPGCCRSRSRTRACRSFRCRESAPGSSPSC
jgi:cell division protein FtsW